MKAWPVILMALLVGAEVLCPAEPAKVPEVPEIEIRGRVVCLLEEMAARHEVKIPVRHEHLVGFKTNDGKFFTLLRNLSSEALFTDEVVRAKELVLKGRAFPNSGLFEVSLFKSVKNGVVLELYYYCEICEIRTVSPEICLCCQGPTRLIEGEK